MTTSSAVTIDLRDSRMAERFTAAESDRRLARQERWGLVRSVSVNVLVSAFYGVFVYSSVRFWLNTGSLVSVGLVVVNTLIVICVLSRRAPSAVTGSIRNWLVASLTQMVPLLLRPSASQIWSILVASSLGQMLGLAIMLASLLSLGRSIGIVAANRGIKTQGPYSWVRHPLYSGEIIFFLSFLLSNWNALNVLLVSSLLLGQVARSHQEESLLAGDEQYLRYRAAVRYRFVPGVL